MSFFSDFLVAVYLFCSAALLLYGFHHYFVLALFWRVRNRLKEGNAEVESLEIEDADLPRVLTQIPLYNEYNVAERVIRAVAAIDYPKDKHLIQVLDDSSDETCGLVDQVVASLAEEGFQITAVRREDRSGYKAGALDYGLKLCDADYVAIFDSDFIPPVDFLQRTIRHLISHENYGLVQARWGFLNAEESPLTKAQSVGIDGHFVVEQVARSYNGYFLNFNGTAGVWRRAAIDDAGGWNADTLTEDLDLSYRAQLRGWKFHYLPHLVAPAELPPSYPAFRSQQFRWAKGSMQTARKILPKVWASDFPLSRKIEATFHLTHYGIHLCMLIHALFALPIVLSGGDLSRFATSWYLVPLGFAMMGPSLLYLSAELWVDSRRWGYFFKRLPMLLLLGFGICFSNARACIEGLCGVKSPFVRTPKKGDGQVTYSIKRDFVPVIEMCLAIYALVTAIGYYDEGLTGAVPFFLIYSMGFCLFSTRSYWESRARS